MDPINILEMMVNKMADLFHWKFTNNGNNSLEIRGIIPKWHYSLDE
jgi:hypothetical protein